MLKLEENDLLTQTGPGTPMGNLVRCWWTPVLLAEELPRPGGPPVRVRILGESLICFRDPEGRLGLLGEHCPHRGTRLVYGRNEAGGLRCVYHGWKFDVNGLCVEMPNQPPEYDFKEKVTATAYPAREAGGIIWGYFGPKDKMPAQLPDFEWMHALPTQRFVSKVVQECNYAQALEGSLDSSHVSFLHSVLDPALSTRPLYMAHDGAPRFEVKRTNYGLLVGARRDADEHTYYWRISHFLLPYFCIPGQSRNDQIVWHAYVPITDTQTMVYTVTWRHDKGITPILT